MENEIINNVENVAEQAIEVVVKDNALLKKCLKVGGCVAGAAVLAVGICAAVKYCKTKRMLKNNEVPAEYEVVEEDESK